VNAVLRTTAQNRERQLLPSPPAAPGDRRLAIEYLSIALSHPAWLAARWYGRFGFEGAAEWMRFNNTSSPLTLRANRLLITPEALTARLTDLGVSVRRGTFAPDALIVEAGQPLRYAELKGLFVVQDEASQLVALLAGLQPGSWVLDTCASPGGKTTAISATMGDGGRIVACDVRDNRMVLLRRTVAATRARNVLLLQADLLEPLPFGRFFDCVIVDAPCSGLGTLRRDPDIRWRRLESDLSLLASDERRMLLHAASVVAPGGRLVYATCSSEPEENEDVAAAFLDASPDFRALDARDAHPAITPALVDERGHLRTTPDRHGLEAFFGAVFTRSSVAR
jgi:16S rRNA (cytosine967-C5)-methyltransferase